MRRELAIVAAILVIGPIAYAATVDYGWENGETIIGHYLDIDAINVVAPDPIHGGDHALKLVDQAASGTPQVYIAWIAGLTDGDVVDASVWRYDTTPGASPSCRIWAHWNDDPSDVNGYSGSAGGNSDYGLGEGWDQTSHSWTVESGHTGLVIEIRTYSNPGDAVWIDDLAVTAPDDATIFIPDEQTPLEAMTWAAIKNLYR